MQYNVCPAKVKALNQYEARPNHFSISLHIRLFGPRREKTCFQGLQTTNDADQPVRPASSQSDQRICYSLIGKHHI